MNLNLGYFIRLDLYGCLTIDSFRIDEVVNLDAPVDARKWLRSQLTEGYRGVLRKNLTGFLLEAVGGVEGDGIANCDSGISGKFLCQQAIRCSRWRPRIQHLQAGWPRRLG